MYLQRTTIVQPGQRTVKLFDTIGFVFGPIAVVRYNDDMNSILYSKKNIFQSRPVTFLTREKTLRKDV